MSVTVNIHPEGFTPRVQIFPAPAPFAAVDVHDAASIIERDPTHLRVLAAAFLDAADQLTAALAAEHQASA